MARYETSHGNHNSSNGCCLVGGSIFVILYIAALVFWVYDTKRQDAEAKAAIEQMKTSK